MPRSYRRVFVVILMAAAVSGGCKKTANNEGPTVDAVMGRLTHNGKPVSFPEGETVTLSVHHEKLPGPPSNYAVQPDGTFKTGPMPVGKWTARLLRSKGSGGGRAEQPRLYNVPGGFTVEEGKTEFNIELGPGWKP